MCVDYRRVYGPVHPDKMARIVPDHHMPLTVLHQVYFGIWVTVSVARLVGLPSQ